MSKWELILLLFIVVPAAIQCIDFYGDNYYTVHISDTPIMSLTDGSKISGCFILGSGSIGENPQFVYYSKSGLGYKLQTVSASVTTIIEDDNLNPHLSLFEIRREGRIFHGYYIEGVSYEIHVPNGTILRDLSLDSELK